MEPLRHLQNFSEYSFAEVELWDLPSHWEFWFQKMMQENQAQLILSMLIAEDSLLMNSF